MKECKNKLFLPKRTQATRRFTNLSPMLKSSPILKRWLKAVLLLLSTGFFATSVQAQRAFSELNIENHFDIDYDAKVDHRIIFNEDSILVYIQLRTIDIDNTQKLFEQFDLSWHIQKTYHEPEVIQNNSLTTDNLLGNDGPKWFFILSLPGNNQGKLLVLNIHRKTVSKSLYYDISLDNTLNYSNAGLLLFPAEGDLPLISNFINNTDTVRIRSLSNTGGSLYAYYYNKVFDPALPPMVVEKGKVVKELQVKDLIKIESGHTVRFTKSGFYFIQRDTSSVEGITIRVENPYFPVFKTMDKIVEPLIYISTGTETKTIRQASDPHAAFEAYWLKLSETPNMASQTIGKFYQQVGTSNFYFTNYKEGWKTDPGMVYLIFGKPDEVYKGKETMDWIYNRNLSLPVIRFTFIKVKNIFAYDHYRLMRKKNYDRIWFKAVELWRKGKK